MYSEKYSSFIIVTKKIIKVDAGNWTLIKSVPIQHAIHHGERELWWWKHFLFFAVYGFRRRMEVSARCRIYHREVLAP